MQPSSKIRNSDSYLVAIFDPFVEPTVSDLCIELSPGELECDDLRKRLSRAKTRKIQYSDGTAQTILPTVLSPDTFIAEALKFEGVKQVIYNADGTFLALYLGLSLQIY